jgi:hypothetical protein
MQIKGKNKSSALLIVKKYYNKETIVTYLNN